MIVFLCGIPASGKSTYSKKFVLDHRGWYRISRDEIRVGEWNSDQEKKVIEYEIEFAWNIMANVIIDDTNLSPNSVSYILKSLDGLEEQKKLIIIDTPIEECIKRNSERKNNVPDNVILEMKQKFDKNINRLKSMFKSNYTVNNYSDFKQCLLLQTDNKKPTKK